MALNFAVYRIKDLGFSLGRWKLDLTTENEYRAKLFREFTDFFLTEMTNISF